MSGGINYTDPLTHSTDSNSTTQTVAAVPNVAATNHVLDTLYEMSQLLKCNVDKQSLLYLINLCELGVNPQILANIVREIQSDIQS